VNLASGAFHGFGCDAHGGDLIAFVRLRDRLSFKDAAQRLGAWDEVPLPETVRRLEAQRQEQQRQRELEQRRAT
jgi:DNA primase